ncbi:solute carrier family 22 member 8 [Elysia marginata]|uniref:Solute carrier family 22 member 8 n=1 Tax=Elysia marginata TaxID=1093978 RepID=A0AAV4F6K2_9GAST|nr:solute carrier family 22 member 8 [Elysia marginata]
MDDCEQELKPTAGNQNEVSAQVDDVLRTLNPRGRYQALHVLVLLLSTPAAGLQLFSNVFTAKAVPHHCASPPAGSNVSDVFGYTGNFTVIQEECRLVLKDNSSVLDSTTCVYGNEYKLPEDASVVSQFDLVCEMDWLARLSQTCVILGQGIGAALTTFLSDRLGRKTVVVTSNFGLLVFGIGAAYAPNIFVFIGLKFLIGACQQGVVSVTTPYFLEFFPTEHRAIQAWLCGGTWGFGVILLSPVAFIFKTMAVSDNFTHHALINLSNMLGTNNVNKTSRDSLSND